MRAACAGLPDGTPVEVWFQDEMRVGQKGTLTRMWAARGSRPRVPRALGFQSTYLFGAVCPGRGAAAGLVLPVADAAAMALHPAEISTQVAPGGHAVVVLDGAGTTPPRRWRAGSRPTWARCRCRPTARS